MSALTIVLIAIIALLAGMEGILDEFQFHQPLVACTLIGLVSGHLQEGVMLGGSLQMIALGWANVGAAVVVAPKLDMRLSQPSGLRIKLAGCINSRGAW